VIQPGLTIDSVWTVPGAEDSPLLAGESFYCPVAPVLNQGKAHDLTWPSWFTPRCAVHRNRVPGRGPGEAYEACWEAPGLSSMSPTHSSHTDFHRLLLITFPPSLHNIAVWWVRHVTKLSLAWAAYQPIYSIEAKN